LPVQAREKTGLDLTDSEWVELQRLIGVYQREADRCAAAGAYLAACVMHGSVLETVLILAVNAFPEEALATSAILKKGGTPKPLLDWSFAQLLAVAKKAKWLPAGLELDDDWSSRKARVGDYAEVVRMVRNLVHPARYLEDHGGRHVTKKYLRLADKALVASSDAIRQKLYASLELQLKADRAATGAYAVVRKLDPADFRAVRNVLEPSDFALSDDNPDAEPTDLIDEPAWRGIMDLPGDVAIRTTSHQGSRVGVLNELLCAWIEVLLEDGIVARAMLDGFDSFQAAVFNLVHGFYKEAIFALRSALETVTFATACQLAHDNKAWERWLRGDELRFGLQCDRAQQLPPLDVLERRVRKTTGGTSIFARQNGSGRNAWARNLYGRLSQYAHARADATNAELWESNGPIYSAKGFALAYDLFLETYAICLILAKIAEPRLLPGEVARNVLATENLALYLDPRFHRACEFYVGELF
jgi:hypothetical protein